MEIVYRNFEWIPFNVSLALVGFVLSLAFAKVQVWYLKFSLFIFWLLFVPNTIYLVTDLQYFPEQAVQIGHEVKVVLFLQYAAVAVIGILTFVYAMYQLQHFLMRLEHRKHRIAIFICVAVVNYLVAFAVILGKIERTHSWYVFTNLPRALDDMWSILSTPFMLTAVILAGSLINLLYFFSRKLALHLNKRLS